MTYQDKSDVYRRTIRTIKVIVETKNGTQVDHEKKVGWALKNLSLANWSMEDTMVAVVVLDEEGNLLSFIGKGTPSPETDEIIKDLFGEEPEAS